MTKITLLFLDLEFTGLHKHTTPISIGIVSDCGKKFYAEFNDYEKLQCDEWINDNVVKKLKFNDYLHYSEMSEDEKTIFYKHDTKHVKEMLKNWLSQFKNIDFWVDCGVWDWLLFVDLVMDGDTVNKMPKNFNSYQPFDIFTVLKMKGINPKDKRSKLLGLEYVDPQHNSLYDAETTKSLYEKFVG